MRCTKPLKCNYRPQKAEGRPGSDASVVSGSCGLSSGPVGGCHMWHAPCNVKHVSCFMSINAIDFVAQPHLHSNKATAEIVATVVVRVCVWRCVCMHVCVCCLYSLCHMQIAATAASRCPVKGFQLPSIYADFRRLRIVQRVFGVFYLASFGCFGFFVD